MFVKIHFILVFQIEITFGEVRLHWPWCVKSCESYCCYKSLLSLFAVPITGTVSVQKHVLKAKQLLVSTGFTNTKAGWLTVTWTILLFIFNIPHHPSLFCHYWPSLRWKQNIVTLHVPPEQCKFHYEVVLINILTFCVFWKQNYQHFWMAVAPASMADKIIVLDDDDEEESPQPSCSASRSSSQQQAKKVSALKAQQPVPTHITQSPFASAKKNAHVLQAENQRLFAEVSLHIRFNLCSNCFVVIIITLTLIGCRLEKLGNNMLLLLVFLLFTSSFLTLCLSSVTLPSLPSCFLFSIFTVCGALLSSHPGLSWGPDLPPNEALQGLPWISVISGV